MSDKPVTRVECNLATESGYRSIREMSSLLCWDSLKEKYMKKKKKKIRLRRIVKVSSSNPACSIYISNFTFKCIFWFMI